MGAAEMWEEESTAASEPGGRVLLAPALSSCATQPQALRPAEAPLPDPQSVQAAPSLAPRLRF